MHLERPAAMIAESVDFYVDRGIVFANEAGRWLHEQRITPLVKRLGERVGYPGMTSHTLRHFQPCRCCRQARTTWW